jgi:hypothetical protein
LSGVIGVSKGRKFLVGVVSSLSDNCLKDKYLRQVATADYFQSARAHARILTKLSFLFHEIVKKKVPD